MFQVPIKAPTASRMKMAPIAEEMPPMTAFPSAGYEWPFLCAISPAMDIAVKSPTCSAPLVESRPNR